MPKKNEDPSGRFSEDSDDYTYLRDVARLVATERRQKRLVLSGEIISSVDKLKETLISKLSMQSTNVRKAFRRLDKDYSGTLDRSEFKRFLEGLNIHTTVGVFNGVFNLLDKDGSGSVEFDEFMSVFGPAIAGEELPIMLDGEARAAKRFEELAKIREARAGATTFSKEAAIQKLTEKLATMSSSVRKVFAHANSDYQTEHEEEGGLSPEEFRTLLDKFNINMTDEEYMKLYSDMDPDGSGCVTFSEFQREFGAMISGGDQCIRWGSTAVPKHHKAAKEWAKVAVNAEIYNSGPDVQSGGSIVEDRLLGQQLVQTAGESFAQEDEGSAFNRQLDKEHRLQAVKHIAHLVPRPPDWEKQIEVETKRVLAELAEEEVEFVAKAGGDVAKAQREAKEAREAATAVGVKPRDWDKDGGYGTRSVEAWKGEGGGQRTTTQPEVPSLGVMAIASMADKSGKLSKAEFMLQRRQERNLAKHGEGKVHSFGGGGGRRFGAFGDSGATLGSPAHSGSGTPGRGAGSSVSGDFSVGGSASLASSTNPMKGGPRLGPGGTGGRGTSRGDGGQGGMGTSRGLGYDVTVGRVGQRPESRSAMVASATPRVAMGAAVQTSRMRDALTRVERQSKLKQAASANLSTVKYSSARRGERPGL